ncbi:hypothetical protein MTO96_013387 [Rhipicephalus appendiculatus]
METFAGHALPGIFFILFGTWWTFAAWRNYVRSRQNKQRYATAPCLLESLQHQTMYAFYLLNGVVDVMYNAGFPFPPRTDYVALLLASASEGLLFHLHLHGRPHLNVVVHTLLVYSMVAMVACIVAEMCRPRSVLLSLGRAYFCLLHGTWLWQIGFVLHNPLPGYKSWDVTSHMDSMLAASAFAWHLMALLVYVGLLGVLAWVVNRTCGRFCHDFDFRG